ncbi:MAG: SpoIIE family protein phosphatase, partial [Treponema sp.]|nr:SpoIIE family protein phosphatase [Treponema sp.]
MKSKIKFSVLAVKLLLAAVFFGILMCLINNIVGYKEFKKQMEAMYGTITRQLATTGSSYIEADYIPFWLVNGPDEHWGSANEKLQELTETGELAFIYVTVVSEDYKSRKYIFDTLNEQLDSEEYKVIPFGHVSSLEKKSPEYIENLRLVMEEGKPYSSFVYNKEGDGHVTTAVPVKDSTDRIIAIMSVVKPMSEVKLYRTNYLRSSIWSALILTLVFLAIYTSSLYFGIIKPIVLINHETSHFAENHGELTGSLEKIKNHDEIGTLAKSVEKMSHDMLTYISDLTQATAEKERLGAELDVATQIQAQMLPSVFPPYENHPELELYATMEPAKEVGGDFYDFFMIDDDHFALVVGDVSGKGVPAALFMVIAKTLIKDAAMHSDSPSD